MAKKIKSQMEALKELGNSLRNVANAKKKKKKKVPSGLRPYRNTNPHIKRNQPCPCGSKLKAKRCCLQQVKAIAALPEDARQSFLAASILQQTPVGTIEDTGWHTEEQSVDPADGQFEIQPAEEPT